MSAFSLIANAATSIASATTTALDGANGMHVLITGTTTITSFGSARNGVLKLVTMAGAVTLTHNGTSLILPNGGSNITTAAGDSFIAVSLGSGNWRVTNYQRADGTPLQGGSALASGSFTPLLYIGGTEISAAGTPGSYSSQTGEYKQILANLYWLRVDLTLSATGNGSGAVSVGGFTGVFEPANFNAMTAAYVTGADSGLAGPIFVRSEAASTDRLGLYRGQTAATPYAQVTHTDITGSFRVAFSTIIETV